MAEKLHSEGKSCSSNIYVSSLNNHHFMLDLPYVDVTFMCDHIDIMALMDIALLKANKTNHLHSFLQYKKYPPLVPHSPQQHPPPNQRDHICPMEGIMFTATWLQSMCPFFQPWGLSKFSVPMWPTSGPMDFMILHVACWAHDEMMRNGETPSITHLSAEMLQYHPKGSNWQIMLELDLDQPCYMKHVAEPWTHLI
ncbi:uncharacterized protein EI90DRAFT_3133010 [Cantharellus anzutake]|uniref:uncharacterized protein n=1 Tax=Cantharellus anzutake TaxID=1750568 RepID=UPI0019066BF4|nr:uncharacterized protein EI90DRAFT_3133010 [Cantharellus anzutake]KAF8318824.1 hypothetical protein EI90DRAFT_3133010 [Cantharellus anzutake]